MNFLRRMITPAFPALIWSLKASAGEPGMSEASRRPTMAQMQASSMPLYKAASGAVEECIGRLVWSADKAIEWPVRYTRNQHAEFTHSFSENVFSQGDEIHFGNTLISVNALAPGVREEVLGSLPGNNVSALRKQLACMETELQKAQARKNGDAKERNRYQSAKSDVESTKKTINAMTEKYKSYQPGIADSYGYWSTEDESSGSGDKYSIFRAYLFAPKYFYKFESSETLGPKMSMETHRKQFSALLASFRPRRMNEIPTELEVCIPFGFLPDDGRTVIDIKQSLRWAAAPGVLYTIHTGNVQARQLKSPVITAAANSQVGRFGSSEEAEVKQHIDQRIGPRQVNIGDLRGEQGGVALKVSKPGTMPYEAYSVFTGYAGWLGTDVLPFILIDMQTFSLEQAPELKVNPPPRRSRCPTAIPTSRRSSA